MDIENIDLNVDKAIAAINDGFCFEKAKEYIESAQSAAGDKNCLAYYDVLNRVLSGLHFYVKSTKEKKMVRDCYGKLLEYISLNFADIADLQVAADSEDEMEAANSICTNIINNSSSFASAIIGMTYLWENIVLIFSGMTYMIVITARLIKLKKLFMPTLIRLEKAAAELMSKYECKNEVILKNIEIWNKEVKKYGKKYLEQ